MPLSMHLASVVQGLQLQLEAFEEGRKTWSTKVRDGLIADSIAVLDDMILDPTFMLHLNIAEGSAEQYLTDQAWEQFTNDEQQLLHFLEQESVLLAAAGFREDYIDELTAELRRVVEAGLKGMATREEVCLALVNLKFHLIEGHQPEAEPLWKQIAKKLTFTAGGAALVGLNASALATTMGMAGPAAALSGVAGGSILTSSAKDIVALLDKPD